ncbi:MAG: Type 1 glutamine amidotransferase-like domain-containing protein [Pseudomonadota bacterium]
MKNLLLASTFEGFGDKIDGCVGDLLKGAHVVCIPTAAYQEEGYENWLYKDIEVIKKRAKSFEELDIAKEDKETIQKTLDKANIIYLTGGHTYCLLEFMKKTGAMEIIREKVLEGVPYFGSSAGAIITSPSIDFIEDMDDPNDTELTDFSGFGFTDFFFIPHQDHEKFKEKVKDILDRNTNKKIRALNDDQALLVKDDIVELI